MSHKLVLFAYSSDHVMQSYISNQAELIKQSFADLNIQLSNEHNHLLTLHSTKSGRFPVIMLFDNGVYQNKLYGKFDINYIISWLTDNLR